jgi:hypothetical protein
MPKLTMKMDNAEAGWNTLVAFHEDRPDLVPKELDALLEGDEFSPIEGHRTVFVMDWWKRCFPQAANDLVLIAD